MRTRQSLYALNRGVVSPLGLARADVKRLALAAETQTNWMPRVLGSMMLRPGFKYVGATYTNAAARLLKFVFATTDTALVEMTDSIMRVWIDDTLLTRPSVSTAVTNGTFAGSLAGWTDSDDAGGLSQYAAGNLMELIGNGTDRAMRDQQVTVGGADQNVEHALRIVIPRGPVFLRVGSTSGGDEYISETALGTGTHSLSLTPTGDFYIRFFSRLSRAVYVSNCTVEAAGVVTLPTPYGSSNFDDIRADQSGDILYLACAGIQQRKIERRGTRPQARSWSIVLYSPEDGPFLVRNTTPTTIAASALTGNVTLTASRPLFKSTDVGGLYCLESAGQTVQTSASSSGTATASVRIIGTGIERTLSYGIVGDASGSTVDLQRSYDNATWTNVGAPYSWTADTSGAYVDGLDDQIIYYRLRLTTRVAPDTVTLALVNTLGSIRGIVRLTTFSSSTSVAAEVLSALGGTGATSTWQRGEWSTRDGWPTSGKFHEGRLWWSGSNGIWGSLSDAFESFDETVVGDSGAINRTVGAGPVDTINWVMSLKGLILGAQGTEYCVRASSLDEFLTPTNFNVKPSSTQGSGAVDAVKIDQNGYFVNRSGIKVFEVGFDLQNYDYSSRNVMLLAPDIGRPGITRMDVQRLPDSRIHMVRADGQTVVAVIDKAEEVLALIEIETDGEIEDVAVLPAEDGDTDDQVYYVIKRTINGSTVRYIEKWAQESECLGDDSQCWLADAAVGFTGLASATVTGLSHLEGEQVVVWADGQDVGTDDSTRPWTLTYTVSGGQIVLSEPVDDVVVGLAYTAPFKSAKLGATLEGAPPLNQQKRIDHIGLVLANVYPKGLKFGPTLDDTGSMLMDDMPEIEQGTTVSDSAMTAYDENFIEFGGTWTTDARVCLRAQAPRPVTVLAVTVSMEQYP